MVSLWGSKDGEQQQQDGDNPPTEGENSRNPSHTRQPHSEPDERTRLLPRNDGYLSPDDPAVSSFNVQKWL